MQSRSIVYVVSVKWEGEVKVDNFFVRLNMEELNKLVVALIMKQGDLYLKTNIPGIYTLIVFVPLHHFTRTLYARFGRSGERLHHHRCRENK